MAWLWTAPHSGAKRGCPRGRDRNRGRYRYRPGVDRIPGVHRFVMISNPDTDCDPDTDPDPEDSSLLFQGYNDTWGSPERQSLSGSHGQRPWFEVGITTWKGGKMRVTISRFVWILMIVGLGLYLPSRSGAQETVVACCSCSEPQFDEDCNYVCPDSPFCECGSPYCAADGSGWMCAQPPSCSPGYQLACSGGGWTCEYAGGGGGGTGGGGCEPFCYCPWFDPYCAYCPYWDPYCEYCDYEWDESCYDCDPCDPSCGSYYTGYWYCMI